MQLSRNHNQYRNPKTPGISSHVSGTRFPKHRRQALSAALAAVICLCLSSCGPHMDPQQSVRPYDLLPAPMTAKSVPMDGSAAQITLAQSKLTANPLPNTPKNIHAGQIYYRYYCLMCHGEKGKGDGPVGVVYVPPASDLTSAAVSGMPDGQIYTRMLHGPGHDPVMQETVQPDERWPLVIYVRSLVAGSSTPHPK